MTRRDNGIQKQASTVKIAPAIVPATTLASGEKLDKKKTRRPNTAKTGIPRNQDIGAY